MALFGPCGICNALCSTDLHGNVRALRYMQYSLFNRPTWQCSGPAVYVILSVQQTYMAMFGPCGICNTLCSTDLHGNVRALRYMLDHPLVFRDNTIHLEKRQKPFEPYRRVRYEEAASNGNKSLHYLLKLHGFITIL